MRTEPAYVSSRFYLEIDGISSGNFVRCSGLGSSVETFEYVEGGTSEVRRLRGDLRHDALVLERGVVRERELLEWFERGDRRSGAVVLVSADGREVARWAFSRGWPVRWDGPVLDSRGGDVALEALEIVHEGIQWIQR
jgi:phage tail-like protein